MSAWRWIRSSEESWQGDFPQHQADGSILHLILEAPNPANVLSEAVLEELDSHIDVLQSESGVKAMVLWSAHDGHFISGADLDEIASIEGPDEGTQKAARGQEIIGRLANLRFPTFAAISGTCLGGGFELSLALDYRIAVNRASTKIGLPEVNLGIIPGFGGTQRLPRLIGLQGALGPILTGSRMPAKAAFAKGLVDAVVPEEGWQGLVMRTVLQVLSTRGRLVKKRRKRFRKGMVRFLLEKTPFGRSFMEKKARQGVIAKTGGHYPAPLAAIRSVMEGSRQKLRLGLELEARLCGELLAGKVSKNLIAIFKSSEDARRRKLESADGDGSWPRSSTVGVLGAGVMGAGIGGLLLERGIATRMRDLDGSALQRGLKQIGKHIAKQGRRRRWSAAKREATLSLLTHTTQPVGFGSADMVIEAIVERLDIKQKALAELEPGLRDDCVFATNTSALSVSDIQEGSKHPERVVGLHFFNPVARMPLVEVIPGKQSADWAVARTVGLAQAVGKLPIVVKDSPGFLVNRLLMPYLDSACRLLASGVDGPTIDRAAKDFGLPMGPLRLLDEVGIDIAVEVSETLHEAFGDRAEPVPLLPSMLEKQLLGCKSGAGFYRYDGSGNETWNGTVLGIREGLRTLADRDIVFYLLDRLIDEAARCLEESVVASAAEVDLAMTMGTGFPFFRGGPLRWADEAGLPSIVERLNSRVTNGEPAQPCEYLQQLVRNNSRFHMGSGTSSDTPADEGKLLNC